MVSVLRVHTRVCLYLMCVWDRVDGCVCTCHMRECVLPDYVCTQVEFVHMCEGLCVLGFGGDLCLVKALVTAWGWKVGVLAFTLVGSPEQALPPSGRRHGSLAPCSSWLDCRLSRA